jgi:hypothetical protein
MSQDSKQSLTTASPSASPLSTLSAPLNTLSDGVKADPIPVCLVDVDRTLLLSDPTRQYHLSPLLIKKLQALKAADPRTIIYLFTKRCVASLHITVQQTRELFTKLTLTHTQIAEQIKRSLLLTIIKQLQSENIEIHGVSTQDDHNLAEGSGSGYTKYLEKEEKLVLENLERGTIDVAAVNIPPDLIRSIPTTLESKENNDPNNKNRQLALVAEAVQRQHPASQFAFIVFDDLLAICNNLNSSPLRPQVYYVTRLACPLPAWRALADDERTFLQEIIDPEHKIYTAMVHIAFKKGNGAIKNIEIYGLEGNIIALEDQLSIQKFQNIQYKIQQLVRETSRDSAEEFKDITTKLMALYPKNTVTSFSTFENKADNTNLALTNFFRAPPQEMLSATDNSNPHPPVAKSSQSEKPLEPSISATR